MKVLLVSPFSDKLVGGIINWTRYIVNYHQKQKENIVLSLLYSKRAMQVMDSSSLFERLRAGISNYLPVIRDFKKIVKVEKYDVVHICTSASYGLIRDLILVHEAKKNKMRTIVHMHFGRIPQVLKTSGWERFLLLRLLKSADCVAVMDQFSLKALQSNGYKNVKFIPNPLSPDVKNLIEACTTVKRIKNKIVYAGHILPTKGVKELVEACKDIKDIHLTLIGKVPDKEYSDYLFSIAGKNAKTWLSIPGNKSLSEVISEMMSCGVFVLPSYFEGFPNVILESMACSCPIVSTPVGAIPEMLAVDSERPCGIVVPVKDVNALRIAIERLMNDSKFSKMLSGNACQRVNTEYTMPKVWNQLTGLWKDVAKL